MLDPLKIRARRTKLRLSQRQVADRINKASDKGPNDRGRVTHIMVSRWETPQFVTDPSLSTLEKLAAALECSIIDLVSPGSPDERTRYATPKPDAVAPAEQPEISEGSIGFEPP